MTTKPILTSANIPDADELALWQQAIADFLQEAYDHSGSSETRRVYAAIVSHCFALHHKHPDDICKADIVRFINHPSESRRNKGAPPSMHAKNQRLSTLRAFFEYMAQYTIEGPDRRPIPIYNGRIPTLGLRHGKVGRSRMALSAEELQRFFAAIPDDEQGSLYRALFCVYFYTARRRNEILSLRWKDITQSAVIENGVPRTAWMYRFRGKGHSREDDFAEMPAPAMNAILAYLRATGRLEHMRPDSPVFVAVYRKNGDGQLIVHETQLSHDVPAKACKQFARAAGLDPLRVSIHVFRHTAATQRFFAGESVRSIQKLLRHSSPMTTEVYLHTLQGEGDQGARLIEARFTNLTGVK